MSSSTRASRQFSGQGKVRFKSDDRTGYLNLDTYRTYSYDSTKHRLTQVQREGDSVQKAQVYYDDTDGAVTKVAYGNGVEPNSEKCTFERLAAASRS